MESCAGASQECASAYIHKVNRVVWIVQESLSFDNYFGTFPGAGETPPETQMMHNLWETKGNLLLSTGPLSYGSTPNKDATRLREGGRRLRNQGGNA